MLGYDGKPLPFFGFKRGGRARDSSRRPEGVRRPGRRSASIRKAEILDADVVDNPAGLKEQMDQVLDKINREGFQSLTAQEKLILEKGSEHMGRQARRK